MLDVLCNLDGVSGSERRVREVIKEALRDVATETFEDDYGNLIIRKGDDDAPRILFAAHMDEVGFMVTGIEPSGILRFKTIGLSGTALLAKHVVVGPDRVPGVVGHKPIHLVKEEDTHKVPEVRSLFIDIGADSRETAAKVIQVGDVGTFATVFRADGEHYYGKAFDNRVGCYLLIELLKKTRRSCHVAFTVQEEAGLRGARIAAYRIAPDIAVAVDTTACGEWLTDGKDQADYPELGKGPVLTTADRSVFCDRDLVALIRETADRNGIPVQDKRPMIGGTDAGAMHLTRGGVRTAVLATPARYIHSPLSIAWRSDIDAGIRLLEATLERLRS